MQSCRSFSRCCGTRRSEHKNCGEIQAPMDACGIVVEPGLALQGLGDEFGDHQRAKSLRLRRLYAGPVALDPFELDAATRFAPCDQDPALRRAEGAVLMRVGGQFMEGKTNVLHRIGVEKERWAARFEPRRGAEQIEMRLDQIAEPSPLPILAQHQVLRFRQTLNALAK